MFGVPCLFLTQSKSLLLLNLIWTLLSPCLNYTEFSTEQKLDELRVQIAYQWKLFDFSPIPSNALFFHTTTTAYSPELHQTIGSSAKWSWSEKAIKRTAEPPSSYRPISLANSIFKVYACMLQQRLAHSIDHLLHPNQYGFRAGRSISTPLFLLRRLTEIFERHSTSL